MRNLGPIFATAMLAALSFGVRADASSDAPRTISRGGTVIHYEDLDIDTEAGARILLQRIEGAAKTACGGHSTVSSFTHMPDHTFEQCWGDAVERTVKQLGAPVVTRMYCEARPRES
jgi:UrcA family protein